MFVIRSLQFQAVCLSDSWSDREPGTEDVCRTVSLSDCAVTLIFTVDKKHDITHLLMSLPNVGQYSEFFQKHSNQKSNYTIQYMHCYTSTLWNTNCKK